MSTTLRKFQVFRNGGSPIIDTVSNIKSRVATMINNGDLVLQDGEFIDVRYKLTQGDPEIRSLLGVAYVDGSNNLTITWTGGGGNGDGTTIVNGNQTYNTVQLGVTENPTGTWTLTSVINPNSLNFATSTTNGVTTYTLQVKNNTSNNWVDTNATFTVDQEKFVDSLDIVTGTWNTSVTPHVFTESPSGTDLAIKLIYSIGGATSSPLYIEIPSSVYMDAVTGGDVWVSDGTGGTTSGNTYIRIQNEAGEYVYIDVTTLVNAITSVTGEAALNGNGSYVAVQAVTTNGAVTLSSELLHSAVTVNSQNDSLSGTNGVLTNASLTSIESYVDNYDCGTFTFSGN